MLSGDDSLPNLLKFLAVLLDGTGNKNGEMISETGSVGEDDKEANINEQSDLGKPSKTLRMKETYLWLARFEALHCEDDDLDLSRCQGWWRLRVGSSLVTHGDDV